MSKYYYTNKGYFYTTKIDEVLKSEAKKAVLYYLNIDKERNIHFLEITGYFWDGSTYTWKHSPYRYQYRVSINEGEVFKRMVWFYLDESLNPLSIEEKKKLGVDLLLNEEVRKKKELEEKISWIDKNITYLEFFKSLNNWEEK